MNCDFDSELIGAYHDGELDPAQRAEVEGHLQGCASCAASLEGMRSLSTRARAAGVYHEPPAYLEARVRGALRKEVPVRAQASGSFWKWAALAACLALAAGLLWNTRGNSAQKTIADAVVASHIRSLLATHLFDVPSEDRHTVKPWFDGKIDFSPDVKDLASSGFRLVGGRLDYLQNRPVAALVFQRRLHVINLFVWPSGEGAAKPAVIGSQQGYNVVHWNTTGMTYWAVADIPAAELEQFGELYQK